MTPSWSQRIALAGLALLCGWGGWELSAKDCVVPFTVSVKRADGSEQVLATIAPTQYMVPLMTALGPEDSIVVVLHSNSYCSAIHPRLKVFDVCGAPGALLHHFPSGPHRHVFRRIGASYLDIDEVFQYSGTACLLTHESAVGIAEPGATDPLRITHADGVLRWGDHAGGELTVMDAAGRVLLMSHVPPGRNELPLPAGFTGGVRFAVLRSPTSIRSGRFIALD